MKPTCNSFAWRTWAIVSIVMVVFSSSIVMAQEKEPQFTTKFRLEDCNFKTEGENPYFILKPGYQLVLEGVEDGKKIHFLMSVLSETKEITLPDIGVVKTRVIEEKEWADGKPIEFARSFFAICEQTNDVLDFGDEVDIFNSDGTVSHDGTWHAGESDEDGLAKPGIFMPGTFLLGSRYYQQQADGLSMERGENVNMGLTVSTEAGTFNDCVEVLETNTIEDDSKTTKTHCFGIGLVGEDELQLIKFGFNIVDENGQ